MASNQEIGKIVDELLDKLIDMDPSPKMILHDPYRTILYRIQEEFGEELIAYDAIKEPSPSFIITKEALEDDTYGSLANQENP